MSAPANVRSNATRVVLLTLLGAVVVVGLAAWWLHTYERVERMVDMPRTGEARRNPLYALQVALRKDGVAVQSRRRLQLQASGKEAAVPLAVRDTVVVYNDPRTLTAAEVDGLLHWVDRGGHLVQPVVGHPDHRDVRLERRERVVGGRRARTGQRVEERRLAGVRQPDDADLHVSPPERSVAARRARTEHRKESSAVDAGDRDLLRGRRFS